MKWDHLSIQPALALVGVVYEDRGNRHEPLGPIHGLAVKVGCDRRQVYRWVQDGVDWVTAERIAWAVGLDVYAVWGPQADWVTPFPELERDGFFAGRPGWYRGSGAADWYGNPQADPIRGTSCAQVRRGVVAA